MKQSFFVFRGAAWAILACRLAASDWAQYRGPNHDGSSPETLRTNWVQNPPRVLWRKTIGPGWSGVTVSGGRIFTLLARDSSGTSQEFAAAFAADNGQELWATPLEVANYDNLSGYDDRFDGPRSTPTVDRDRVYVFTGHLKLLCLRADNGVQVWKRDFVQDFNSAVIPWQNAASPLLIGDRVFVNGNGGTKRLMALDKATGKTLWAVQSDGMTHATPVSATLGGVPQVVFLTMNGLVGVTPDAGDVLWRYNFSPSGTSTAATPVVAGDSIHASCAYGRGSWNARVTKAGGAFSVTDTRFIPGSSFQNHWASPVHHAGFLYSIVERSGHSLACFDPATRANRWTTPTVGSASPGFGSIIKVGGVLVVLTESGELVLVQPNPDAYTEIARFQALRSHCWNHPAMSNGRLYVRGSGNLDDRGLGASELVALDVAAVALPLPPLLLAAEAQTDAPALRLTISGSDGTPLDATMADRLEVQSATLLPNDVPPWTGVSTRFTVNSGRITASIPITEGTPAQFLRVREKITGP